jgi:hypothetical protein
MTSEMRFECLKLAHGTGEAASAVVERATVYAEFISGGAANEDIGSAFMGDEILGVGTPFSNTQNGIKAFFISIKNPDLVGRFRRIVKGFPLFSSNHL